MANVRRKQHWMSSVESRYLAISRAPDIVCALRRGWVNHYISANVISNRTKDMSSDDPVAALAFPSVDGATIFANIFGGYTIVARHLGE